MLFNRIDSKKTNLMKSFGLGFDALPQPTTPIPAPTTATPTTANFSIQQYFSNQNNLRKFRVHFAVCDLMFKSSKFPPECVTPKRRNILLTLDSIDMVVVVFDLRCTLDQMICVFVVRL